MNSRALASSARCFCTNVTASRIPATLAVRTERVRAAVKVARDAAAVAAEDNSDDVERAESLSHGKYAIKAYDDLLLAAADSKEAVVGTLGKDVDAMKHELYMSRKQRVWMGWRGWF